MNKKEIRNRVLSAVLSLGVCLTLTTPSFAAGPSKEDATAAGKNYGSRVSDTSNDSGNDSGRSLFVGPSFHLSMGIRMKKSPDLDTYYSTVGGVKFSLFGIQAGRTLYISCAAPGLQYAGYGIFAPSFTPLIFNHSAGFGFGVDFFPTRRDRTGGPVGMSFNLDVVRLVSVLSSLAS